MSDRTTPTMTTPARSTLDRISLDLPEGMRRIDGDAEPFPGTDPGRAADAVTDERRWISDDGLYVVASTTPATKGPELDPLALDLVVGGTVERYRVHFSGSVDSMTTLDVTGAVAGRGVRMHLESASGEALELMLVAALTADREVVTVQATWPAALAVRYGDRARALGRSLAIPAAT